ncbi:unnamed protein product [Scytosiphon promiscuus]
MLRQVVSATATATATPRQIARRTETGTRRYRGVWERRTLRIDCAASSFAGHRKDDTPDVWERFLRGGLDGISRTAVRRQGQGGTRLQISWNDGHESEFSSKWLRDHATDAFNPHTKQRQVDTHAVPNDIKVRQATVLAATAGVTDPPPTDAVVADAGDSNDKVDDRPHQVLRISWDGEDAASKTRGVADSEVPTSTVPLTFLREHCTSARARELRQRYGRAADGAGCRPRPILWGADVFCQADRTADVAAQETPSSAVECLHYDEIVGGEPQDGAFSSSAPSSLSSSSSPTSASPASAGASARLVGLLRSRGIALVRGVPTTEEGTRALALNVGGNLRSTLYGPGMWATSAEASAGEEAFRDSAYSSDALALHTDCGYLVDPPGVQVFNCVVRAEDGGTSTYIDGFAVAERLRLESPAAFEFFSRTSLVYQCFDEGCHYMAEGPIFRLGAHGHVVQVRHNDYDRAPLDYLSNEDIDLFYEHHKTLSAIIRDPSLVARILLEPGDCVILDNQRTLHGRESFKGRRRMVGCYLGMDELHSMARVLGL